MSKTWRLLKPALICFGMMTLLCGVIYPAAITGLGQLLFPDQANGSVITVTLDDGTEKDYGSALLAQEFTKPEYLIGRPSGVSNLSPTSEEQAQRVQKRIDWWHSFDPGNTADIPLDLVTASGSGADPQISPAAAEYQVARVAKARNMSQDEIRAVIKKYTTSRFLGLWGEPAVNVQKVNLALDGLI